MNRRNLLKTWLAVPLAWLGFKASPATARPKGLELVRQLHAKLVAGGAKPLVLSTSPLSEDDPVDMNEGSLPMKTYTQSKKSTATNIMAPLILLALLSLPVSADDAKPTLSGQVSAGWNSTSGNTHTDTKSLSVSAERRTEGTRLTGGLDYARGKQSGVTTEDWFRSKAKYDYFVSPRWYGFVNGRYDTDTIALLDSRTLLGGGAGYQLVDRDDMHLSIDGGLATQREEYSLGGVSTATTAQLGYSFDHQIVENVKFVHDLSYFPDTHDTSDYYLTSTAEVRANFTKRMFCTVKAIYSRDTSPAAGRANSDVRYILGVGWGF